MIAEKEDEDAQPKLSLDAPGMRVNFSEGFSSARITQAKQKQNQRKKCCKWTLIVGGILIVLALAITIPILLLNNEEDTPVVPSDPYVYNPYTVSQSVDDEEMVSGYITSQGNYQANLHAQILNRLTANLKQQDPDTPPPSTHGFTTLPHQFPAGNNNKFIKKIKYTFGMHAYDVGYLTMTDADSDRYSVPEQVVGKAGLDSSMKMEMLGFELFTNPFSFKFSNIRIQAIVFGFGERTSSFALGEGTWTMWAKDQSGIYDDGTGGKQSFGVHPFILVQGKNKGDFFGMYFRNSNAQSPVLRFNNETGGSTLSYITTGGQIEIVFFMHGSAKGVIQQYQNIIGSCNFPPFWSLGWQQASKMYRTQTDVENMIKKYDDAKLPLEVIWVDTVYLKKGEDFIVDTNVFPDMMDLADIIHKNNQNLIITVPAALTADSVKSQYFSKAQKLDILIKSNIHQKSFQGALSMKVLSDHNVFIDWLHPDAKTVWEEGLTDLYKQVPFDGLYLDMNEATGFCDGECPEGKKTEVPIIAEMIKRALYAHEYLENNTVLSDIENPVTSWYKSFMNQDQISTYILPFIPGFDFGGNLDNSTLSLNASHPSNPSMTEYDLHNVYGHMMSKHTREFLTDNKDYKDSDKRPFVISRSSFSGTGKFASHSMTKNGRDWQSMKYSISGMFNMNMFGIFHSGADVCGSLGKEANPELCARWIQLATFYPFARLNYEEGAGTEPYNLQGQWLDMAKASMLDRFQYLRHMYACYFEVSQWGGACFDPLIYYYPQDDKTFEHIDESFMVSGALKISPVLEAGITDTKKFKSYFPAGRWVSMADISQVVKGGDLVELPSQQTVHVHLRQGALIAFQNNSDSSITRTSQLLKKPITIIANRDDYGKASGNLYLDQGISRKEVDDNQYEYHRLTVQAKTMQRQNGAGTQGAQDGKFEKLVIVDAEDLADTDFACMFSPKLDIIPMDIWYDKVKKALHIIPKTEIMFNEFKQVNFGSSAKKELNLCLEETYSYHIKDGKLPDLTKPNITIVVQHDAGVLPDLNVTLRMVSINIVNIRWNFNTPLPKGYNMPFQVPKEIINIHEDSMLFMLQFLLSVTDKPFQITVHDFAQENVLTIKKMLLDTYLNIFSTSIFTPKDDEFTGIVGLGERVDSELFLKDGVYSMWNMDTTMPFETGKSPGNNVYGTHPFIMYKSAPESWVGVFLKLAAAQDWYIKNDAAAGQVDTTMVATGSMVDLYVILDYTPQQVSGEYFKLIGRPVLLPQWALGWHQCKWGYRDVQSLVDVVGNYSANNIPLEVQWSDVDYMDAYRDFTTDPVRYKDLGTFVEDLRKNNMHYVPIVDAGVAMRTKGTYQAFDEGMDLDMFIKINDDQTLIGQVWPKDAAYPDWFNPKTKLWWDVQLAYLHNQVGFDGLWLDMNEVSNFCGGVCFGEQTVKDPIKYHLKYTPTGRSLESQSIPLDAYHFDGNKQIDTHSLYGTMEVKATHEWFKDNQKRTFIISRSSFVGMGKYGSKWLGDNSATPRYMGQSVTGTMMMNIFGIPFVGSDICGFMGDTNGELCARWHIVGAFQPFSRNHNTKGAKPQEPYVFANEFYEEGVSYMSIMKMAIRNKYHLIRYYYTELTLRSQIDQGAFYQPMFFQFPNDINATKNATRNIMLGEALKLSVLSDAVGQNQTEFYFPKGVWCNIYNLTERCFHSEGEVQTRRTLAYDFYVHLRGGNMIPLQNATELNVNNTVQLQNFPVEFHILGEPYSADKSNIKWKARGRYINDDGLKPTIEGNTNGQEFTIEHEVDLRRDMISINFINHGYAYNYPQVEPFCNPVNQNDYLSKIYVYNAKDFKINDNYLAVATHYNMKETVLGTATYDHVTDRLVLDMSTKVVCIPTMTQIYMVNIG